MELTAGPTPQWAERAKADAGLIFSGAEYMMSDLLAPFREEVDASTVTTLYLQPSALLVRKANPRGCSGLRDLLGRPREQSRLVVTQSAGGEEVRRFAAFLAAPVGAAIFRHFGWSG